MSPHKKFPLVSGHLSVDLVNTEVVKRSVRQDLLADENDLADWLERMHLSGYSASSHSLLVLKELRARLREVFEDIADGTRPTKEWITYLERLNHQAPLSFKLIDGALHPSPVGSAEDSLLSLIAFDTLQLLADGDLLTLHRCANPDCVLLFLDTTGRRKWCSMRVCGNRTKVARHQDRAKKADEHQ